MKQLGHASQIIPLLHPSTTPTPSSEAVSPTVLLEVLSKQLSHSDGIRGFFAVYLTSPESIAVDEDVPAVLVEAVRGADLEVMVPLACELIIQMYLFGAFFDFLISSIWRACNENLDFTIDVSLYLISHTIFDAAHCFPS